MEQTMRVWGFQINDGDGMEVVAPNIWAAKRAIEKFLGENDRITYFEEIGIDYE